MSQTLEALVVELKADVRGLQAGLQAAAGDVSRFSNKASDSVNGFQGAIMRARTAVLSLGVAWAGFRIGKGIVDAGMQMEAMRNRMLAATGDARIAADALAFVRQEADRLGIGIQTASNGFAGFSASALRAGLTLQQTKDIFTGVSEAAVSMRLPAEQVGLVFKALEQIAGKGTVSMEELRGQLGDALPGAFEIAAKAMGKTTAEFSAMVANGEVLAGEFLPKFGDAVRRELGGSVEEAAKGAQAAFNRLGNAFFDLQTQMADSGFLDVVTDGVKDLTAALNDPQTAEGLKGFASMMADIASAALRAASAIGTFYVESDKAIKKAGDSLFSTVFGTAGSDAIANARRERSLNQSEDADNARLRQQAIDELTRKYSAQAAASGSGSMSGYTLGTKSVGATAVGKKSSGPSAQEKAAEQAERLREQMARQVESMRYGFAAPGQQASMDRDSQQETLREALEAKAITEQEFRDLSLQAEVEYHERLKEIRDSARDEELTSMEAFLGMRLKSQHELNQASLAEQASSFRSSISEAAKHNKLFFAMEKARAIASALIAARESVVHAYNFGSRIGGPYLGAAFAGVAAAAQAVNIGAIASTSFNSGGGGSVSSSGAGGMSTATENGTQGQVGSAQGGGRSVYITLNGDDATFYSKNNIRKLLENMNDALSDGSQLRVVVSS